MRDAHGGAIGSSVREGELQAREDDGFGGAAQLAFQFQDDALLRDVEREGDAGDVGGDQREGICCRRFDCVGGEVACCLGKCGEKSGRNRSAPPKDCFLRKGAEGQGGFRTARPYTRSRLRTLSCRYASGGTKYENYGLCAVLALFLRKSFLTPYHWALELRRRAPSIMTLLYEAARRDTPAEYPGCGKVRTFSATIPNSC